MRIGKKQFLIENQTADKVKVTLQEFENKYQNFKSRWDFELLNQRENLTTAQIVDHGYESPREKGQSDSPVYEITLEQDGDNVVLNWRFRWKRSKRNLSWILLWLLVVSRVLIFLTIKGEKLVLMVGIWVFWAILYGGWLLQNYLHDQSSQNIFREMLRSNFGNFGTPAAESVTDTKVNP